MIFGPRFFSQMNASPLFLNFCIFVILMEGRIGKDDRDDRAGGWRGRWRGGCRERMEQDDRERGDGEENAVLNNL